MTSRMNARAVMLLVSSLGSAPAHAHAQAHEFSLSNQLITAPRVQLPKTSGQKKVASDAIHEKSVAEARTAETQSPEKPVTTTSPLQVRVRVGHFSKSLWLNGSGLTFNETSLEQITQVAVPRDNSIEVRLAQLRTGPVWIMNSRKTPTNIRRVSGEMLRIDSFSGRISIGGKEFLTPLVLSADKNEINAVALVAMEDYVQGVLAGEMPSSWPLEALKAQAVAARSYVIERIAARKDKLFHVESTVADQVFLIGADRYGREKYRRAVEETSGLILTQGGRVLRAHFHSDCGGQTEEPRFVWAGAVRLGSVTDAGCSHSAAGKWTMRVSWSELARKLAPMSLTEREANGAFAENYHGARVVKRSPTGRALLIAFNDDGMEREISGQDLRAALGFDKLKSTLFEVRASGDQVIFEGRGHGHGSGLCQGGARFMADAGAGYTDILKHYFGQSRLTALR